MNKIIIPYSFSQDMLSNETLLSQDNLYKSYNLYVLPFRYDIENYTETNENINYIYTRDNYTFHIKAILDLLPYNLYLYIPKDYAINQIALISYYLNYLELTNYIVDTKEQFDALKKLNNSLNVIYKNDTLEAVLPQQVEGEKMIQKQIQIFTTENKYQANDYKHFFDDDVINNSVFIHFNASLTNSFWSCNGNEQGLFVYYLNDLVLSYVPFYFDAKSYIDLEQFTKEYNYYKKVYGIEAEVIFNPNCIIKVNNINYRLLDIKELSFDNTDLMSSIQILQNAKTQNLDSIYKNENFDTLIFYDSLGYKSSNIISEVQIALKEFSNYTGIVKYFNLSLIEQNNIEQNPLTTQNKLWTHKIMENIEDNSVQPVQSEILPTQDKKQTEPETLSIIIPYYKSSQEIREGLYYSFSHLFNKKFIDLIFVCDGSDDEDLMKKVFKNIDIKTTFIKLEKNMGVGVARQAGLNAAKGSYICFWDSDDLLTNRDIYKTITTTKADIYYATRISISSSALETCFTAVKRDLLIKNDIKFTSLKKEEDTVFVDIIDAFTENIYSDKCIMGIWNYLQNDYHITAQGSQEFGDENAVCAHLIAAKIILEKSTTTHAVEVAHKICSSALLFYNKPELNVMNYNIKYLLNYALNDFIETYNLSVFKSLDNELISDKTKVLKILENMSSSNPVFINTEKEFKKWYHINE